MLKKKRSMADSHRPNQANASTTDGADNFKVVFKKYKRRDQKLDLSAVVDVDKTVLTSTNIAENIVPSVPVQMQIVGVKPVQQWKIYHFLQHRGFYLIRNPFLPGFQRYWVSRCLGELPLPPNVTNLRVHPDIDPSSLWSDFESHFQAGKPFDSSCPLRKLRWTTIGYHYNWDTKEYKAEDYTQFPEDIGMLARYTAEVLGFNDFQAEAGIINYYHLDSTLAGHTDHSEFDHEAPLISISFGQDAIFLLGGETKATEPTAILLRSGDICVMSGHARLAYHAVPRILCPANPVPPPCFEIPSDKQEKEQGVGVVDCTDKAWVFEKSTIPNEHETNVGRTLSDGVSVDGNDQPQENIRHRLVGLDHQQQKSLCQEGDGKNEDRETGCPNSSSVCSLKSDSFLTAGGSVLSASDSKEGRKEETDKRDESNDLVKSVSDKILQTLQTLNWEPCAAYLCSSRINVNIRQVLKPGQTFPRDVCQETEILPSKKPCTENNL